MSKRFPYALACLALLGILTGACQQALSAPVFANGVVYFGSLDGKLYALSTAP